MIATNTNQMDGTQYKRKSADETLSMLWYEPKRRVGERGATLRRAA